jgi:hypothetical protein
MIDVLLEHISPSFQIATTQAPGVSLESSVQEAQNLSIMDDDAYMIRQFKTIVY